MNISNNNVTWKTVTTYIWREHLYYIKAFSSRCEIIQSHSQVFLSSVIPKQITLSFFCTFFFLGWGVLAQAPRLQLQQQADQVLPFDRRGSPTLISPTVFAQTRPARSWPSTSSWSNRRLCRTAAPSCRQRSRHPRTAGGPRYVGPATKS